MVQRCPKHLRPGSRFKLFWRCNFDCRHFLHPTNASRYPVAVVWSLWMKFGRRNSVDGSAREHDGRERRIRAVDHEFDVHRNQLAGGRTAEFQKFLLPFVQISREGLRLRALSTGCDRFSVPTLEKVLAPLRASSVRAVSAARNAGASIRHR
jgi:hypothetical protein